MKSPAPTIASRPLATQAAFGLLAALVLSLTNPLQAADKGDADALLSGAREQAAAQVDGAAPGKEQAAGALNSAREKAAAKVTDKVPGTQNAGKLKEKTAAKKDAATDGAKAHAAAAASGAGKLDINSASEAELASLPGIGAARAKAIIKGRPYKGKDDLQRRNVLSASVYEKIKDRIVARQR
ncbi:MAG: helix-hairpin-helix domain-containing protein [Lautropia sp.]|nr:helix-hairpin-helix domain-containing protein [Lautropia sp.]